MQINFFKFTRKCWTPLEPHPWNASVRSQLRGSCTAHPRAPRAVHFWLSWNGVLDYPSRCTPRQWHQRFLFGGNRINFAPMFGSLYLAFLCQFHVRGRRSGGDSVRDNSRCPRADQHPEKGRQISVKTKTSDDWEQFGRRWWERRHSKMSAHAVSLLRGWDFSRNDPAHIGQCSRYPCWKRHCAPSPQMFPFRRNNTEKIIILASYEYWFLKSLTKKKNVRQLMPFG